ncbi:AAEL014045-PA [Gryllus bimaculatus]|nr:AAEL014045-PA [Gryllus bimaculatus]
MAKRPSDQEQDVLEFTQFNDLCNETVGGQILFATDDWFAVAENLLKSVRVPGIIKGVLIDTAYFTDEECIPQRKSEMGRAASEEEMRQIQQLQSQEWAYLLPMTPLKPGYEDSRFNYFNINNQEKWTHLRFNLYPDGGIARLRVFGEVQFDRNTLLGKVRKIDLLSILNGSVCVKYSNAHYGHPRNIMKLNPGKDMGDGWETARRLDRPSILKVDKNNILQVPGNEWAIFKLGCSGTIQEIEVDTSHFKGNFPDSIKVEGTKDINGDDLWEILLPPAKLSPHKNHIYLESALQAKGPFSYIRVTIAPDGGISRLRLWGHAV